MAARRGHPQVAFRANPLERRVRRKFPHDCEVVERQRCRDDTPAAATGLALGGAVVAQEDSSERATAGNAGHVSVEERRDDREGSHRRDQADDEAGDHGEGVPGPAQQLPCDVFQIHVDCTWQPCGGRESVSIALEGRQAFTIQYARGHKKLTPRLRRRRTVVQQPLNRRSPQPLRGGDDVVPIAMNEAHALWLLQQRSIVSLKQGRPYQTEREIAKVDRQSPDAIPAVRSLSHPADASTPPLTER